MKDRDLILHRLCDIGNSVKNINSFLDNSLISVDTLFGISVQLSDSGFRSMFPIYGAEKHDPDFYWKVNVVVDGVIFHCASDNLAKVYEEE